MNIQGAKEPEIEQAAAARRSVPPVTRRSRRGRTSTGRSPRTRWYIPVYEDFTYYGYNADKVAEPAFAGENNYLVLSAIQPAT